MEIIDDSKVVSGGILLISKDNKVLAFSKLIDNNKIRLPGGTRQKGESSSQNASRELFEETGLDIDVSDISEIFYYIPDDNKNKNIEGYFATFVVRSNKLASEFNILYDGKDENGNLEGHARWVKPEDFLDPDKSVFPDYLTQLLKSTKLID